MQNVSTIKTPPVACPVCGRAPYVEQCAPWPSDEGPAPWAVGCYSASPTEHFVGVNGDTEADAVRQWNVEVGKIGACSHD